MENFNQQFGAEEFDAAKRTQEVEQFLMINKKLLADASIFMVRDALMRATPSKFNDVKLLAFKDTTTTLLLSIFLGFIGIDRFYIGDTGMGVGKIFLNVITCGIFTLIDILLCYKRCKEKNTQLLLTYIA